MRDPKRIPVILEELRKYWEANPDLRLGQIIHNIICHEFGSPATFYAEDDVIFHYLQRSNMFDSGISLENFLRGLDK